MEEIELTEDQLLAAIKEAGIDKSFQKYIQKIGDQRTNQGIKSYQKNQDKKDLTDKERIESLEVELKEMKDNKSKEDIKILLRSELKKSGLNEGLLKYIKTEGLDDQSKIADVVKDFKEDFLNAKQAEIDQKLKGNEPPAKGEPGQGGGDSTLKSYAENKNAGVIAGNPFKGKLDNKEGE